MGKKQISGETLGMGERDDWTVYFRKDGGPLKTIYNATTEDIVWAVKNPDDFDGELSLGSYDLRNDL
jgi:hypothetical protein|tara:strand:- start:4224 stop:4424 length:201 start_codon:yes stop_codon:yes gene_type:complete